MVTCSSKQDAAATGPRLAARFIELMKEAEAAGCRRPESKGKGEKLSAIEKWPNDAKVAVLVTPMFETWSPGKAPS